MVDNQNKSAMKRNWILVLLAVLPVIGMNAQGTIKGNVKTILIQGGHEVSEAPLVGAEVYVTYGGSKIATSTNNHGDYTLKPLEPGVYNVTISSILIDTLVITGINVTATSVTFIEDKKVPLGRSLDRLVITSSTSLRNASPSKGELKGTDMAHFPEPTNINKAIELMGSTWVSDDGRQISFRGARIGDALYIVDGVRQRRTDVSLPNGSIATINAWHGGVPAEYGDFMGGVVVIETMSYFDWENQQEVKRLIKKKEKENEEFRESQSETKN
jgi:hypothetical protein